ncbi:MULTISPECIES: glycosyltransferase family 4 protein [Enterobacter cloacae complex]|uniref:Glycosyltransferase family 4 protein n=1 Tax=Enterobacter cloacae TaxID=550 RepID=A0A7H8UF14_ENTCL|nr:MULTISPECIES: glycosyltransferase family 4 protein [Enterobacter cloacae complex]MDE4082917.1 glycosyltransferase family 4 protein [Enterobacter pasteurii]QKZ98532.1 glycosyltransferase family 4 protein [Enterobacter cloacae]
MKVMLLHNEIKTFRVPLFQALSLKYNIDFYCLRKNHSTVDSVSNVHYGRYFRIPKMQDLEIPMGLWKHLKEKNPDVIISTDLGYAITYIGFAFAKMYNKKFVLWNEQWCDIEHPRRKITKPLEKYICKKSDIILAFGEKHGQYAVNLGADPEKIVNVPNAVPDIEPTPLTDMDIPWLYDSSLFKIVCPARLVKFKGHITVLDAITKIIQTHSNIRVIFAGSGPELKTLNELVCLRNLSQYVYITNKTYNSKERDTLFTYSDLIILASLKSRGVEAWGLVINEAAMFGKKIIVSDATGTANELVLDKITGRIFKSGNSDSLAECISSAYEKTLIWNNYSLSIKQRVHDKYSMDLLIKQFKQTLDRLM